MQIPSTVTAFAQGADAVATLNANMFPSKLIRLNISGPAGSSAVIFVGGQKVDQTARAQSNTAEYTTPLDVPAGSTVSVTWTGQSASASQCSATFTIER